MTDYILNVVNQTSKLDWAFPFQRTGAFPIDRSSLFSSLEDAIAYASGSGSDERALGGTSYVGQPISVYDANSNSVSLYIIDTDRSLKEVGITTLEDDITIENVDGKIQLKDFGVGYYSYNSDEKEYVYTEGFKEGLEPKVISIDGNLTFAWVEPIIETNDDIIEEIGDINNSISEIKEEIGIKATNENEATGIYKIIDEKANKNDVYTKTETDTQISNAVAAASHLKRIIVDSVNDIDVNAANADQFIYMVLVSPEDTADKYDEYMVIVFEDENGDIIKYVEKIGSWEVDLKDYAKTSDVNNLLENKVDKVANSRLMTNEEGEKLSLIQEGAQKNYIASTSNEFKVEEGQLSLQTISQDKVSGLVSLLNSYQLQLDNKINTSNTARLITNEEAEKLNNIKDLIQTINSSHFTLNNGELNLNDISISKVTGLQDQLNKKVSIVYSEVNGEQVPWTLLSPEGQAKLNALVLGDEGNIEISGKVNASNVEGLSSWITTNRESTLGLFNSENEIKLNAIQDGAERNYIASVDENVFAVIDRNLRLKNIDMTAVTGLEAALQDKASQSAVTNLISQFTTLENNLNIRTDAIEDRMSELDARLTWQRV